MGKTQKRMGKTKKRMDKPKKRMSKTQKRMGKTQKRMGKTKKRMSKRGGDSPELSDEEKVRQYLRQNWSKNYKVSFRSEDKSHLQYPLEKLRTMDAEKIRGLHPLEVGYYYFNDTNLSDEQRKALAEVLVKKINYKRPPKSTIKNPGVYRGLYVDTILNGRPLFDTWHLTDEQIDRLPANYIRNDLDPKFLGYYQGRDWRDNASKFGTSTATAIDAALDRKKKGDPRKRDEEKNRASEPFWTPGMGHYGHYGFDEYNPE